jgi:ATP-dependent DNA helicase DinG
MIAQIFGAGGALEKGFRRYEPREGQVRMAEAVERAIADRAHLAVEAPCGIGKTYAYLVPAIAHALSTGAPAVVCTANIALQEQIFGKDLPALGKALPWEFTAALLKGLNNYLCLDRFEETAGELSRVTFDRKELRHWEKIRAWRHETLTGDLSDLDFEPEDSVWNRVNGVSELCNGAQCRFQGECFALEARRRARQANLIVTNYHLFFAHLAVRAAGAGDVILPSSPLVICDEAHEMADIARDFFAAKLSPWSIGMLVRAARFLEQEEVAEGLRSASREFFGRVRQSPERRLRTPGWTDAGDLLRTVAGFKEVLLEARRETEDEAVQDKISKFASAADRYAANVASFLELGDPNLVYWVERDDRAARLCSRVIDVSGILDSQLFQATPTVVMTSATLTAAGDFGFLKRETGAAAAREIRVPSPFDLREQAIVVVPRMKAAPNDPGFAAEMSGHLNRIIRFLRGRTMCLFTSYRNLEACAAAAASTGVDILKQGDRPRSRLLAKFRKDQGTALFATSSFWQGVDIPGEALSCLTIDRIPFANPDDPLVEALQERDPACFANYSLPKAILDLRQGFGRLIRTVTDRGAVVLFDNRLFSKRYGAEILGSLPGCRIFRDLEALERFFNCDEEENDE